MPAPVQATPYPGEAKLAIGAGGRVYRVAAVVEVADSAGDGVMLACGTPSFGRAILTFGAAISPVPAIPLKNLD